ncbi:hypothetical protein BC828DRAFT_352438, partial [Blastocladiella britannica]
MDKAVALNLSRQSVAVVSDPVSDDGKDCTSIYRNAATAHLGLLSSAAPDATTAYQLFFSRAVQFWPDSPCLGTRARDPTKTEDGWADHYTWLSYSTVADRATAIGSGLLQIIARDVLPASGGPITAIPVPGAVPRHHIGIYARNRAEWVLTDLACVAYSMASVALYDTLGADALQYIVNHAELRVVVAAHEMVPVLIRAAGIKGGCEHLRVIVAMDPVADQSFLREWARERGVALYTLAEVEAIGAQFPSPHVPPQPTDLASLCYTSGTTGNPKGVMLQHKNFAAQHMLMYYGPGLTMTPDDVHLSYLPLAHIFERSIVTQVLASGGRVGFFRGDPLLLVGDLQVLQPTIFPSVPRLLNRIYATLRAATLDAPGVRGALFRRAYATKRANLMNGDGFVHPLYDRLLFSKVRQVLGGRLRFVVSGSAPIQPEVLNFFRIVLSCNVVEGYAIS